MKKRHKHYLIAFLVGYLGATCLMVYGIYSRGLEAIFSRLLVYPVVMGVLISSVIWQVSLWDRLRRREREGFRKRGWNWKAYRITVFVLAVLAACVMAILRF